MEYQFSGKPRAVTSSSSSSSAPSAPSSSSSATVAAAAAGSSSAAPTDPTPKAPAPSTVIQEYSVRVPKYNVKPTSLMRFNGALNVDPLKWTSLRMVREDHHKHKSSSLPPPPEDDNIPKFGAGSEYGREAREEARRKKYGGHKKRYNADELPWIMRATEKTNKKYRGVKEGGVAENASYYIFTQAHDGAFEVFPVHHWYNFTPIQRYKSLNAEEAEEQFGRRNKIYNYFSVMVRKRLKAEDDDDEEKSSQTSKSGSRQSSQTSFKVSEMDDWAADSDLESSDSDKEAEDKNKKKPKKKGAKPKKKKGSDEEAEEDSDDGDEEGRELDYISDTSETESEEEKEKKNAVIGVDQEDALKKLLDSDSDEEENENKKEEGGNEEEEGGKEKNEQNAKKSEESKDGKKKSKKKAKVVKHDQTIPENLSDDEDDEDIKLVDELDNAIETAKMESGSSGNNSGNSRDGTPESEYAALKRKATSDLISGLTNASKKAKLELSPSLIQSAASEGITEEAVRRYLLRKPMTVTELLQKFKSKKTKISSHDMVNVVAQILKKINPVKRTQNQKMYLYLTKS